MLAREASTAIMTIFIRRSQKQTKCTYHHGDQTAAYSDEGPYYF
jgi:hypothetical protein